MEINRPCKYNWLRCVILPKILVDSCGWVALINSGINVDSAFLEIFGKYEFILIDNVLVELERIEKKKSKKLLLKILKDRSSSFKFSNLEKIHTDDVLLNLSIEHNWPVLTVDKKLKSRLHENNCKVVEVVGGKKIKLVIWLR